MSPVDPNERFIRNLDDHTKTWRFRVVGDRMVVGQVFSYLTNGEGVPLTITVGVHHHLVDIPWTSIQTIEKVEERHA